MFSHFCKISGNGCVESVDQNFKGDIADLAIEAVKLCLKDVWDKNIDFDPMSIELVYSITNAGSSCQNLAGCVKNKKYLKLLNTAEEINDGDISADLAISKAYKLIINGKYKTILLVSVGLSDFYKKTGGLIGSLSSAMLLQATDNPEEKIKFARTIFHF